MSDERTPLYLDYNATTPLDERVLEAMMPWFGRQPGNAGSRTHEYGTRAKDAVEFARRSVAEVLGSSPQEIVFTSGATESNNIAILGLRAFAEKSNRKHIISTSIEHKAVLEPLEQLKKAGFDVEFAPVNSGGFVETREIESRLRPDTLLVSVMHANNETGVIQPAVEIGELLDETETLFHVDAAQTFGKEVEELLTLKCDFLSVSGHKVYGPTGIGALYVRRKPGKARRLRPIAWGGGQERGLRPGTTPVPLVVGLGKASELALSEYEDRRRNALVVKEKLLAELESVEFIVNGDQSRCQSHVLNLTFPGVDSEALMMAVKDSLACSNGSACTSSSYNPSHVLIAMGLDEDAAEETVRISWGLGVDQIPVDALRSALSSLQLVL